MFYVNNEVESNFFQIRTVSKMLYSKCIKYINITRFILYKYIIKFQVSKVTLNQIDIINYFSLFPI